MVAAAVAAARKRKNFPKSTKPKPLPRRLLRLYRQKPMKRQPMMSMRWHRPKAPLPKAAPLPAKALLPLLKEEAAAEVAAVRAPAMAPAQEAAPVPEAAVAAAAVPVMAPATVMAVEMETAAAEKLSVSSF